MGTSNILDSIKDAKLREQQAISASTSMPESEKPSGALAALLQVISEGPEFPAFSENIQELLTIKSHSYESVQAVSRIILRDLSLTTKILKSVNSILFKTYQAQVHTITNAIMLLGLDRIRDMAIGLRIFENFRKSKALNFLKRSVLLSLCAAIHSQELTREDKNYKIEEVFITTLMFNVGELVAAFYFPTDFQKVLQMADQLGIPKGKAFQKAFKVSLPELGLFILKKWGIADKLIDRLNLLHYGNEADPTAIIHLRKVIHASQELSEMLLEAPVSYQEWQRRAERICQPLGMDSHRLAGFLKDGVERFQALTETIRIDIDDINLSLPPLPSAGREETGVETATATASPLIPFGEEPTAVLPVIAKESEDVIRLRFRYQVMEEINKALISRLPVNEILGMIMEGIYRGIGFDRTVFCLVNPQRTEVRGRLGLGEDVEEMIPLIHAGLTPTDNILAQALLRQKEFLINPQAKPKDKDAMSDEFWRVSRAKTFFVSPVLINNVPVGVFYVDRLSPNTSITAEDIHLLQTFRNLTILAFESRKK